MLVMEFEPMTLVFERAKTVHVLDSAATVLGRTVHFSRKTKNISLQNRNINLQQ
jgi:hypothetical protein